MLKTLATGWSPEQWATLITAIFGAFGSMVIGIVVAIKTTNVHNEVRPPSNGVTLGALAEGIAQVQHTLVAQQAEVAGQPIPQSATQIGRDIQSAIQSAQEKK